MPVVMKKSRKMMGSGAIRGRTAEKTRKKEAKFRPWNVIRQRKNGKVLSIGVAGKKKKAEG